MTSVRRTEENGVCKKCGRKLDRSRRQMLPRGFSQRECDPCSGCGLFHLVKTKRIFEDDCGNVYYRREDGMNVPIKPKKKFEAGMLWNPALRATV